MSEHDSKRVLDLVKAAFTAGYVACVAGEDLTISLDRLLQAITDEQALLQAGYPGRIQ